MMFDSRLAAGVAPRPVAGLESNIMEVRAAHTSLALGVLLRARRTEFSLARMARSDQGALKRAVSEGCPKGTVYVRKGWVAPQTEWGGGNHGSRTAAARAIACLVLL